MSLGFGHRGRIGHLYPSGGLCDYEIQLMAPEGIQFVTTRLPFRATGVEDDLRLVDGLESQARMLTDAQVDIIALNCTAATLLAGPERLNRRITDATGIESVTTIEAVLAALAEKAVRRVALVTPYPKEVATAEVEYLSAHGVDVTIDIGIPCATPVEQATIDPGRWRHLAESVDHDAVDAILFSCAGIRISGEIDVIEQRTGLPVITSNQALLWHVLRKLDVPPLPDRFGSLLTGRSPDREVAHSPQLRGEHPGQRVQAQPS